MGLDVFMGRNGGSQLARLVLGRSAVFICSAEPFNSTSLQCSALKNSSAVESGGAIYVALLFTQSGGRDLILHFSLLQSHGRPVSARPSACGQAYIIVRKLARTEADPAAQV